jgi:hypothetical protein
VASADLARTIALLCPPRRLQRRSRSSRLERERKVSNKHTKREEVTWREGSKIGNNARIAPTEMSGVFIRGASGRACVREGGTVGIGRT